jgi:hypothetical protein
VTAWRALQRTSLFLGGLSTSYRRVLVRVKATGWDAQPVAVSGRRSVSVRRCSRSVPSSELRRQGETVREGEVSGHEEKAGPWRLAEVRAPP